MEPVDNAKIELWKKEHGAVFLYQTKDGKKCYLKKPTLMILDAAKMTSGNSAIKFNQILLENCWLSGDVEIKTQDEYLLGLFEYLPEIILSKSGELRRL